MDHLPNSCSKHTLSVHAGQRRDENAGVVNSIDPSTAFQYIDQGAQPYPRYFNTPGQQAIVEKLCRLENAESGLIFSSGMAAVSTTLMALLRRGDHGVMLAGLYGGTHSFVLREFEEAGVDYTFAGDSVESLAAAMNDRTRVVFIESPTNPLLRIIDLAALASIAGERGVVTIIDNTFASPINQNPIDHGIDLVIHSGTKYLGGHSDLSFGAVLGNNALVGRVRDKAIRYGGNLNALTCYLVERSLKTLAIRVEQQTRNAGRIAEFLAGHEGVGAVHYPGLPDAHGHEIAARQMHGFGGMLSFELHGDQSPVDFLRKLRLVTPAMSLGGVETTCVLPVHASHRQMPVEQREALGITDRLIRLSVGIEDASELIDDLLQALRQPATAVRVPDMSGGTLAPSRRPDRIGDTVSGP